MAASSGSYNQGNFDNPWAAYGIQNRDPSIFLKKYSAPLLNVSDFSSGFKPLEGYKSTFDVEPGSGPKGEFDNPTPDEDMEKMYQRNMLDAQYNAQLMDYWFNKTREQNLAGALDMLPLQTYAAQTATNRNLLASKDFRSYVDMLPSSVQARNLSYQTQANMASEAAARSQVAMATAQDAAARASRINYNGRTFGVS